MQGCRGVCLQALELFAVWQELWGERQLCGLSMDACFVWDWLPETQVGQGWCSAPVTGKRMLCLKGGQPSASAEGRNETDCVKETQMLKMLCIILSGDVYCKYHDECTTPLLAQLAGFF